MSGSYNTAVMLSKEQEFVNKVYVVDSGRIRDWMFMLSKKIIKVEGVIIMREYEIFTDSSCDLPKNIVEKYNLQVMQLEVVINELKDEFSDRR